MTKAERREQQATLEREWAADQQARPNVPHRPPPAPTSPEYCAVNPRGHRHSLWTSKKDGRRRCYYCCEVFPPRAEATT